MAYQVDRFNGTFLTSVADGTIDTTTDIRFVGKNYAGYGEVQNENFLHILENFANTTAPPKAIAGQIWYDSGNKRLKFYNGNKWKIVNGSETGSTSPTGLEVGEFWWDTAAKQLFVWSGTEYILVGPETSPDLGASTVSAQVVKDTTNTNHTILKMAAGGKVVAIVSQTEFTLNSTLNPIDDFTNIKKGITIAKTNNSGVSTDYVYWGNASNALSLGGVSASEYIQKGGISFDEIIHFENTGYTLGGTSSASADLAVLVENEDNLVFDQRLGAPITFRISVSTVDKREVSITSTGVTPNLTQTLNLGSNVLKWNEIFAKTVFADLVGNVTGNTTGDHTGSVFSNSGSPLIDGSTGLIGNSGAQLEGTLTGTVIGSLSGTADNATTLTNISPSVGIPVDPNTGSPLGDKTSIPVRDPNGDITANKFKGTADKADRVKIDDAAIDTDPSYRSAMTTATGNTIAARNPSGDLVARFFVGTATSAQYADLAEKYTTDQEYASGTVVSVCEHDDHDVEACKSGDRALGVVSTNPAYMMNSEAEGQYIALKGRVPCKVGGKVKKGQRLIAGGNGYAVAGSGDNVFGIALESSDEEGIKLIEVVVL